MIVRVKLVAPRLLVKLNVMVSALPHGVFAGTVKLVCRLTVVLFKIVP